MKHESFIAGKNGQYIESWQNDIPTTQTDYDSSKSWGVGQSQTQINIFNADNISQDYWRKSSDGSRSWEQPNPYVNTEYGSEPLRSIESSESGYWSPDQQANYNIPIDGSSLGTWGDGEDGGGDGRSVSKRLVDATKGFLGNPETQDKAKQFIWDYGKVALSGAIENAGIYSDGRIRKSGVLKAIIMPKRAARKAVFGATGEVTRKARSDSEHLTMQAKEKLTEEGYRRAGPLGGFAMRGLIKLSPI
ncbi:hypothetical protein KA043_03050 [Candidatus Saccharibacteria bacterium]|nr:hypothetical protein [Candidatus Saccharibacteria bacterium]